MLKKAQAPDSAEHTQILNHLHSLHETSTKSRSEPRPPPRRKPELPREPILINVAKPGEIPKYISNILPRPRETLGDSERKVPSLCATADGQPFVRIKKPQPRALSRMVGRKGRIFQHKIYKIVEVDEELSPDAVLEDEWDRLMVNLLRKEKREPEAHTSLESPKTTYSWTVQLCRLWWEYKVEKTWQDWVVRGTTLHNLVEEEKGLAEQEKGTAAKNKSSTRGSNSRHSTNQTQLRSSSPRSNIIQHPLPPLPLVSVVTAALAKRPRESHATTNDPFVSQAWAALVTSEQGRMLKWMGKSGRDVNDGASLSSIAQWKRPEKATTAIKAKADPKDEDDDGAGAGDSFNKSFAARRKAVY